MPLYDPNAPVGEGVEAQPDRPWLKPLIIVAVIVAVLYGLGNQPDSSEPSADSTPVTARSRDVRPGATSAESPDPAVACVVLFDAAQRSTGEEVSPVARRTMIDDCIKKLTGP